MENYSAELTPYNTKSRQSSRMVARKTSDVGQLWMHWCTRWGIPTKQNLEKGAPPRNSPAFRKITENTLTHPVHTFLPGENWHEANEYRPGKAALPVDIQSVASRD
ncbi:unnamed protein product [Polarella glacialis]|uniref:Uncharacterized protein n=1 Tax=Polarella glacialis TaxID=89957 RepID=A0A813E6Q7_POLGL|nr:unnamed protein product [Polarella glacialis]